MLSISPADGSRGVKTSAAVTVTPVHAQVTSITVTSGGAPVGGVVSEGGTVWHSRWALHTSSTYRVTAAGISASGKTVSATSSFRTITPSATMGVRIFQGSQQTYGVGMPIILTFSGPVTRKSVTVTGSPAAGTWGDGWTVWFWTWRRLMRGSALDKAVMAGPGGSHFVSPSSLSPWSPSSPLQGPEPGNNHAD